MRYNVEIEISEKTFHANVDAESWDEAQKKALGNFYADCMGEIDRNWNQYLVFHNMTKEEEFFYDPTEDMS